MQVHLMTVGPARSDPPHFQHALGRAGVKIVPDSDPRVARPAVIYFTGASPELLPAVRRFSGGGGRRVLVVAGRGAATAGDLAWDLVRAGASDVISWDGCYLDVCAGTPLICNGRGLIATGNYFRAGTTGTNTLAISFGASLTAAGSDPAAVVQDNTFDLNGSTSVRALAQFSGFTAEQMASGGGEYRNNLAHNQGHPMPASWAGQWIGSDGLAVANTTTATLDLASGPVLSGTGPDGDAETAASGESTATTATAVLPPFAAWPGRIQPGGFTPGDPGAG